MTIEDNKSVSLSSPVHDFNSLNLRLNPEPLLEKIEVFLRGTKTIYFEDPKTKEVRQKRVKVGNRKANEDGIQSIYNWIAGVINVHVVQGNFPADASGFSQAYEEFIYHFRIDFSTYIMINMFNFEISDLEYEGIIDFVLNLVTPYMTRLINNEERKNYQQTIRNEERAVHSEKGKSLFSA